MPDVYYVNDTSGVPNWGSQATNRSFRELISETGADITRTKYTRSLHEYEGNDELPASAYVPRVVSNVLKSAATFDYKNAYDTLQEVDDAIPEVFSQFDEYARATLTGGALTSEVEAIESSDLVLINLEGYGHKAGRSSRALLFIAYLAREYLDTECVLANVTLDPLDDELLEMAENVLPLLDDVVFREPVSAREYSYLCTDYRLGADPVFSADVDTDRDRLIRSHRRDQLHVRPYATNAFDPEQPYVCVGGNSVFVSETHHREAGLSGPRSRPHVEGYVELCRELGTVFPQIVLVVSSLYDELVLSSTVEALDAELYVVGLNTSIGDSIRLLANAEVYVGGRYHPTIFAAMGGVPIVPISAVSHKVEGVMELLGVNTRVFDPFELVAHAGEIGDLSAHYLNDSTRFDHVPSKIEQLADAAALNVQHLRS